MEVHEKPGPRENKLGWLRCKCGEQSCFFRKSKYSKHLDSCRSHMWILMTYHCQCGLEHSDLEQHHSHFPNCRSNQIPPHQLPFGRNNSSLYRVYLDDELEDSTSRPPTQPLTTTNPVNRAINYHSRGIQNFGEMSARSILSIAQIEKQATTKDDRLKLGMESPAPVLRPGPSFKNNLPPALVPGPVPTYVCDLSQNDNSIARPLTSCTVTENVRSPASQSTNESSNKGQRQVARPLVDEPREPDASIVSGAVLMLSDSGYGSISHEAKQHKSLNQEQTLNEDLGQESMTLYSGDSSVSNSPIDEYILELCHDIHSRLHVQVGQEEWKRISMTIVHLLKGFALRLGCQSFSSQQHREAMYFIHKRSQ
jgi:hypothetical protein